MRSPKVRFEIRKRSVRSKIRKVSDRPRLSVFKSGKHIYAQVIDDTKSSTIVAASTLDKEIKRDKKSNKNKEAARKVGESIAKKALAAGVTKVVFDKGGYKYHGVIKELSDAARAGNLEF